MKRKGVLFTLLIILLVIVFIVAGFLLLFSIKTFDVQFSKGLNYIEEKQLLSYINEFKGTNAFAFNKDSFVAAVEVKFPYAEILSVERVFPSKVVVTVSERMPLYAMNHDSAYYIFDKDGKLLGIDEILEGKGGEFAPIEVSGVKVLAEDKLSEMVGLNPTFSDGQKSIDEIKEFFSILERLGYNYAEIKTFLQSVEIDIDHNLSFGARLGTNFVVYDFDENSEIKIQLIMAAYTSGVATEPTDTLIITNDLSPKLSKK